MTFNTLGHSQCYWCTKYNQWSGANFILFADGIPYNLAFPEGLHWAGTLGCQYIYWPKRLCLAYSIAFYHGSGDWVFAAANAPTRVNAGFLDGHVESMPAEDFMRDFLSKENVARCPSNAQWPSTNNDGSQYIGLLPPYGTPSHFYP